MKNRKVRFYDLNAGIHINFSNIIVTYLPPDPSPCARNPCGVNAICKESNKAGSCACIPNYHGDPYISCRPECMTSSECPMTQACINLKCKDPCPGVCGQNAVCSVNNHSPTCTCFEGYRGDPFEHCYLIPKSMSFIVKTANVFSLYFSLLFYYR